MFLYKTKQCVNIFLIRLFDRCRSWDSSAKKKRFILPNEIIVCSCSLPSQVKWYPLSASDLHVGARQTTADWWLSMFYNYVCSERECCSLPMLVPSRVKQSSLAQFGDARGAINITGTGCTPFGTGVIWGQTIRHISQERQCGFWGQNRLTRTTDVGSQSYPVLTWSSPTRGEARVHGFSFLSRTLSACAHVEPSWAEWSGAGMRAVQSASLAHLWTRWLSLHSAIKTTTQRMCTL